MSSHQPELNEILNELCVTIGARPTGSEANCKAQEYISRLFEQAGYEVELQDFDCMDWHAGGINLRIGTQPVPVSVSPYSLPCDVTAFPVLLEDISALEASELHGKIAVLAGDLTKEVLMPKNFRFWNPEEHRRIISLLEEKRPEAIVTVSFHEQLPTPVIEDGDFQIPCAVIPKQTAPLMMNSDGHLISLRIEAARKYARAANVIARWPGKAGQKRIVLSAHFDTKPGTPGALDNASGVALLLTLADLLRENRESRTLEFVCFNGEDYYSNPGEVAYLDAHQAGFDNILLDINCDGVGLKNSRVALSYMGCPGSLISLCEAARKENDLFEVIDPWPQGDHMLFVMHGVPALTVTSADIFSLMDTVIHTQSDTIELLDVQSISDAANMLKTIVLGTNLLS